MAQSVKHPTLALSSGHHLMVCDVEPHGGLSAGGVEPAWVLSLLLSALTCLCSLSLSK